MLWCNHVRCSGTFGFESSGALFPPLDQSICFLYLLIFGWLLQLSTRWTLFRASNLLHKRRYASRACCSRTCFTKSGSFESQITCVHNNQSLHKETTTLNMEGLGGLKVTSARHPSLLPTLSVRRSLRSSHVGWGTSTWLAQGSRVAHIVNIPTHLQWPMPPSMVPQKAMMFGAIELLPLSNSMFMAAMCSTIVIPSTYLVIKSAGFLQPSTMVIVNSFRATCCWINKYWMSMCLILPVAVRGDALGGRRIRVHVTEKGSDAETHNACLGDSVVLGLAR